MAKTNTKKAFLLQKEVVAEKRIATISTRPMKVAFLIREDITRMELIKYLEYNTSTWGGYYNLLIPTNGKTLKKDWHNTPN
jgi:hypothetical protein